MPYSQVLAEILIFEKLERGMAIRGKDLKAIGFPEGRALGLALKLTEDQLSSRSREEQLALLANVLKAPATFVNDPVFFSIARALTESSETVRLEPPGKPFQIYGPDFIEEGALSQMQTAMRLPVTVAGALMPDAHQGYGLPIGGVLATRNAVIPYGVGVDIGCRMCMTVYAIPVARLEQRKDEFKRILIDNTRFGFAAFQHPKDHEILGRKEFSEIAIARQMKDRAWEQIGTSGGGNHFVEFGVVEVTSRLIEFNLAPGIYLAVLSHSGSRGLGANIARYYTKIAMETCKLPGEARHLAWLDLESEKGQEYWLAMNLAGDYASACHHQIHERIAHSLHETPLARIENHHNFAWKEKDVSGTEYIVHRKGATPAGQDVLGIIPGSMATPGFIVRGKGVPSSLRSASHGAGRTMSRTKAKQTILPGQVSKVLKAAGVELIGAGLDEAPMAYKDIHQVMKSQEDLVEVMGTFMPKIVRMCGEQRFKEVD